MNEELHGGTYREYPEQYLYADRDFKNGDRVVFVGPPDDEYQPAMICPPESHKLLHKRGQIRIGRSEDIRVYPDDPANNMLWVKFDDDRHPLRQVAATWLVKEKDFPI